MGKFFDTPKPQPFQIKPRYWDPKKEEREEREKRARAKLGLPDDDGSYIPNIKGQFKKNRTSKLAYAEAQRRKSTVRLFFILTILMLAAYFIVFKYVDIF